jgi:hypothetical protein
MARNMQCFTIALNLIKEKSKIFFHRKKDWTKNYSSERAKFRSIWSHRVARSFKYMTPKPEKCTKLTQNYQMLIKYISQTWVKKIQMATEYINIFQPKALQNLPKLVFVV